MENVLRTINCSLTMPYFDWSVHSQSPWTASVWSSDQLGGNSVCSGRKRQPCCVKSGPFRAEVWNTSYGECLKRHFRGTFPDMLAVQLATDISVSNFSQFEIRLRLALHDGPHCLIGGTMCTSRSADAPEFFLHHAFVDAIWWRWQSRSLAHRRHRAFHSSKVKLISANGATAHDFHDLEAMTSENIAACYEGESRGMLSVVNTNSLDSAPVDPLISAAQKSLNTMAPKRILSIPRAKYTSFEQQGDAIQLFRVKAEKVARAMKLQTLMSSAEWAPHLTSADDRMCGFNLEAVAANRTK